MNKILLTLLISLSTLFSAMTKESISQEFLRKNIKIFDIRTAGEWKQTGIIKGSIPLTFFNEQGQYDVQHFVKELNLHLKQGESFALICASGSRTHLVGTFLGKNGFNVIDLTGGIMRAMQAGIALSPYTK